MQRSNLHIKILLITAIILCSGLSPAGAEDYDYQTALVPAPPQGVVVKTEEMQSVMNNQDVDAEITRYLSPKSAKEIIGFYKDSLKETGWQVLTEADKDLFAYLVLTKDNKVSANIMVYKPGREGSEVFVAVAQTQEQTSAAEQVIEDAYPLHLWAPSYPGAVRRMYRQDKQNGQVTVVYATTEPVQEVAQFYSEMMPNNGWWLKKDFRLEELPGFGRGEYQNLVFADGQASCLVSVNRPADLSKFGPANQNLTAILLSYTPQR